MHVPPRTGSSSPDEVLRRLDLAVSHRLDGLLHGEHRGLVPGHGSEVGETRPYRAGDDIRRIDWNVTARMVEPHVRETIADRELETWVLTDLGPTMDFGTAFCEKRDLAISATAAVGFLTARTGNRFGLVIAGVDGFRTVPARGGRRHLFTALHVLLGTGRADAGSVDLGAAMTRTAMLARRRGLVVVVSDLLQPPGSWERALRRLTARHEVIVIEILDPRELALPDVGMVALSDPGSGRTVEVRTSRRLRRRYEEAAAGQRAANAAALRAAGADHLVLRTDSDWLLDIVRFVAARRDRAGAARAARNAR